MNRKKNRVSVVFTKRSNLTQFLYHCHENVSVLAADSTLVKRRKGTGSHTFIIKGWKWATGAAHRSTFDTATPSFCPPTWRKTHMTSWQQACVGGLIKQEPTNGRLSGRTCHYDAHFALPWIQENANTFHTILIVLTGRPAATVFFLLVFFSTKAKKK